MANKTVAKLLLQVPVQMAAIAARNLLAVQEPALVLVELASVWANAIL